jgi:hypothetical protein
VVTILRLSGIGLSEAMSVRVMQEIGERSHESLWLDHESVGEKIEKFLTRAFE